MKASPFTGIVLLLVIIIGVLLWFFVGEPLMSSNTATSTPEVVGNDTENNNQTGPLTPAQLEARVVVHAPNG